MSTESEESSGLIEFLTWIETHKQKLVVGGIGAIVIGSAVYVSQWKADQSEQVAGTALYDVLSKEGETEEANKPSPDEYLAVETAHAGTSAAERALLLAARGHFMAGDYDKAKSAFERFQTQYADSDFVSTALYGVAASDDAAGNLNEAKSGYQAVLSRFPNTPVAAQAKLATASIHESAGEAAEAIALYDELTRPGVPASYSSRALSRREKLFEKHPELRPEPEAVSSSVAPTTLTPSANVTTETTVVEATEESSDEDGSATE